MGDGPSSHVLQWAGFVPQGKPSRAPHVLPENLLQPGCGEGLTLGPQQCGNHLANDSFSRAALVCLPRSSFWMLLLSQTLKCRDPVLVS